MTYGKANSCCSLCERTQEILFFPHNVFFRSIHTVNGCYIFIQNSAIGICNGETMCLMEGTKIYIQFVFQNIITLGFNYYNML